MASYAILANCLQWKPGREEALGAMGEGQRKDIFCIALASKAERRYSGGVSLARGRERSVEGKRRKESRRA